jgi:hypothetical protein
LANSSVIRLNSLSKIDVQQIYADFENGELTGLEAQRAFELLGEHEMVEAVEKRMAIEEEMDPTALMRTITA